MNVGERIKEVRLKRNKTLLEIANMLGVSEATVQRYESGNIKNLKLDTISKIASFLDVDPAYLMGWRNLPENIRIASNYKYYPISVSAGLPIEVNAITESDVETISIPDVVMGKWAGDKDIFITRINGESMNNVFPHNSVIAVKHTELSNIKNGEIVVYSDGGEYSVKRFINDTERNRLIFRPDSNDESFTDYIVPYSDAYNIKIHGKVVVYVVESE